MRTESSHNPLTIYEIRAERLPLPASLGHYVRHAIPGQRNGGVKLKLNSGAELRARRLNFVS
jgi:hypothetical protein